MRAGLTLVKRDGYCRSLDKLKGVVSQFLKGWGRSIAIALRSRSGNLNQPISWEEPG